MKSDQTSVWGPKQFRCTAPHSQAMVYCESVRISMGKSGYGQVSSARMTDWAYQHVPTKTIQSTAPQASSASMSPKHLSSCGTGQASEAEDGLAELSS